MNSMVWSSHEISLALVGRGLIAPDTAPFEINGIQTDSRQVQPGDLFVCLVGERFDAHDFAEQVVNKGAAGLVVSRKLPLDCPQWVVDDTRVALGSLGKAWRLRFDLPVWAVVGSNGKTTTKEMLASVAKAAFGDDSVCVTQGNLNNDIGVPLTLFQLRSHHKVAVIEMGMNHPGEIDYLAGIVCPDAVVMTNAQREHQEFMKTVEAVARENGSAFSHLNEGGCAIYPAGTSYESIWKAQAANHRTVTFGGQSGLVNAWSEEKEGCLSTPDGQVRFAPKFLGDHNYANAAAVGALAWSQGISLNKIAEGLQKFSPVAGRMRLVAQTDRLVLIDDTYNANPDSVNAATNLLSSLPGRSILILGDMGEVGEQAGPLHAEVGTYARQKGVELICLLGEHTRETAKAFGEGASHFESLEQLLAFVETLLEQSSWNILVKGSRFMKMERVVGALVEGAGGQPLEEAHAA